MKKKKERKKRTRIKIVSSEKKKLISTSSKQVDVWFCSKFQLTWEFKSSMDSKYTCSDKELN